MSHFINNQWIAGQGAEFQSTDPGTLEVVWTGREATAFEVDQAVLAARAAFVSWAALSFEKRLSYLEKFKSLIEANKEDLARTISSEVGKPFWEALTEVGAMIGKLGISVKAYQDRCKTLEGEAAGAKSITRFKPHGVVAIFGPYNFPGHLANGHILPALLAGNTIVLKPSELTPKTSDVIFKLWEQAGLPAGVVNLVQGARTTGEALSDHADVDGVFFTGSSRTGQILTEKLAKQPHKILALEMGGNNPLIVWDAKDQQAAVYNTILSAFLTSGQRCTCSRRLILPDSDSSFVPALQKAMAGIQVGHYQDKPEPFMGPVVSEAAAKIVIQRQADLIENGATSLVAAKHLQAGTGRITPGLIDVTEVKNRGDIECFGPLLQVIRVPNFSAAIQEANNTAYGLSAGVLSDDESLYRTFWQHSRAGIVNWNNQLTGASGAAPFGGIGLSGNHRPSAYFAADYCAYPVASMEKDHLNTPDTLMPGLSL